MKITDLAPRTIAIYAGRFHPFHIGHGDVFRELAAKFGIANTYVATSGKVVPETSPFSFAEKLVMMQAAGIPVDHVVEETVPYSPRVIPSKLGLNPEKDILVFGVGQKDMNEDPRFSFSPLKDGTPSYFQRYTKKNLMPFSDKKNADGTRSGHGYVVPVKDVKFTILGKTVNSASKIRELYRQSDDENRLKIIEELYPQGQQFYKKIKRIFDSKLGEYGG